MTLIEMIQTTGTIPKRFTTTNGVTMEYDSGQMKISGEVFAGYWQIVNSKKHHMWVIKYGATEDEAKEKVKEFLIAHGRSL